MRRLAISLITVLTLATCLNVASAQGDRDHHGRPAGTAPGVRGPVHGPAGPGVAGPRRSFSAPTVPHTAYSGTIRRENRARVLHAPAFRPRVDQRQYTSPRTLQQIQRTTHLPSTIRRQYRAAQSSGVNRRHAEGLHLRRHTARIYTQRRMKTFGSHHHRYRHRRRGYTYYLGGWWYAFPWWEESYSDYDYWSDICSSRWGFGTRRYYRCMAYYGFY